MNTLPMSSGADKSQASEAARVPTDVAIRTSVLTSLGRPPELHRVAVMPLWGNYYRVNVLIGADVLTARIAHSYFVEAGDRGEILAATPPIARLYL